MQRSMMAISMMVMLTCLPASRCQPGGGCPSGETNALVGYDLLKWQGGGNEEVFPAKMLMETGNPMSISCYTILGTSPPALATYPVFFTPTNEFDRVGFPVDSNGNQMKPANLDGAKVRIISRCWAEAFLEDNAIVGVWVDSHTGRYREQFVATPNFVTDSGLIDGRGALCFYNRSNVPGWVTVEQYVVHHACVSSAAPPPYNPGTNLIGTPFQPGNIINFCPAITVPPGPCDPGDAFGNFVFCEVCSGSLYTSRITREFYNFCESQAKEQAQVQASNCGIEDGPCN